MSEAGKLVDIATLGVLGFLGYTAYRFFNIANTVVTDAGEFFDDLGKASGWDDVVAKAFMNPATMEFLKDIFPAKQLQPKSTEDIIIFLGIPFNSMKSRQFQDFWAGRAMFDVFGKVTAQKDGWNEALFTQLAVFVKGVVTVNPATKQPVVYAFVEHEGKRLNIYWEKQPKTTAISYQSFFGANPFADNTTPTPATDSSLPKDICAYSSDFGTFDAYMNKVRQAYWRTLQQPEKMIIFAQTKNKCVVDKIFHK
jgi:hypothetical protein